MHINIFLSSTTLIPHPIFVPTLKTFSPTLTHPLHLCSIRNLEDNVETPGSSGSSSGSSSSGSAEKGLVSNSAEMRYREVLAVSLPRRPLFPGGLMPVSVQDKKLIDELTRLKKGGCVPFFYM